MACFVTKDTNPGSLRISLSRLSKREQNKHAPLLASDDLESGDEAFQTPSSPNRSPDQDGGSASDEERSAEPCNDRLLWTQSYMCPIDSDVDDISISNRRKGHAKRTKTHTKNAQQDSKSAEKRERPKRGHKDKLPESCKFTCPVERERELENSVLEVPQKKCSQPKKAQDVPESSDQESNKQTNKHILTETVSDPVETQKTQTSVQSPDSEDDLSMGNSKSEHSDKHSGNTDHEAESVLLKWKSRKNRGSKRCNEDSSSSSGLEDDMIKQRIKKMPKRRRRASADPDYFDWLIVGSSDRPRARRNRRGERKPRQGPIECEVCGRSISCKAIMERHMLTHTGEKPFECSDCGRRYTSSSNLRIHQQSHTGKMDFSCEECGQKFTHLPYLKRHLLRHSGKKQHICDQCGKGFIQKYHLERHMLVHTGQMPYACDKCDACFKRRDYLNLHMRSMHLCEGIEIDLKTKLHKCDECEKTFVSRAGLEAHRRVHTGVTPYSCTICQRKFKQSSQMHSHMRTHSGEKPHSCDLCGMKFTRKNYVHKHKERKHGHERESKEQS